MTRQAGGIIEICEYLGGGALDFGRRGEVPLELTWHFQAADERMAMIWGLAARLLRQVN